MKRLGEGLGAIGGFVMIAFFGMCGLALVAQGCEATGDPNDYCSAYDCP